MVKTEKSDPVGVRKSNLELFDLARKAKRAVDGVSRFANKAPLYLSRVSHVIDKSTGKLVKAAPDSKRRSQRLISKNAFRVAASGATQRAYALLDNTARAYGEEATSDSKRAPALVSLAPGAVHQLQLFLSAYCQTAFAKANICKELGLRKAANGNDAKHACLLVDQAMASYFLPFSHLGSQLRLDVEHAQPDPKPRKSKGKSSKKAVDSLEAKEQDEDEDDDDDFKPNEKDDSDGEHEEEEANSEEEE